MRAFRLALGTAVLAAATTVLVVAQGVLPAYGAPALVQTGPVVTSATKTLALTLPSASTSGNLLIAVLSGFGDSTALSAPGGWTQAQSSSGGGLARRTAIYYYANNPGGISGATWTFGNATTFSVGLIIEFSGMATLSPLDVFGRNTAVSSTTDTASGNQSNNSQTSYANEIEVTVFQENLVSASTVTFTPGAGYTNLGNTGATSLATQWTADYKTGLANNASASETETSSVVSDATVGWEGMVATFAPAPTCTGGSLTLATQSVQFNSTTLNGKDKTVTTSNNPPTFTPSDQRGTGAGWNITLTSTQFTSGGHTIPTTATTLTSVSDSSDGGTCVAPTNTVTYPITVPAGAGPPTAVKIYNAAANTGEGDSQLTLNFSLVLPSSAYVGSYTSTWTFSIVSGP